MKASTFVMGLLSHSILKLQPCKAFTSEIHFRRKSALTNQIVWLKNNWSGRAVRQMNAVELPKKHEAFSAKSSPTSSLSGYDRQTASQRARIVPFFRLFYNDVWKVNMPPRHRFPMDKYRIVRKKIQGEIEKLTIKERELVFCDMQESPLASLEDLTSTHSHEYVDRYMRGNLTKSEIRNIGFPWSREHVNRTLSSIGGTVAAANAVCRKFRQQRQREFDASIGISRIDSVHRIFNPIWAAHIAGGELLLVKHFFLN